MALRPIQRVVECEACGRILEAPLMTDAKDCCKRTVKDMSLAYAVKEVSRIRDADMTEWEVAMLAQVIDATLFTEEGYNEDQQ